MVLDNACDYRLNMPQRVRQAVLLMPRSIWASRLSDVAPQAGQRVPATATAKTTSPLL